MTVRFRITALATLAVFVVLTVAGVGLTLAQRRVLTGHVDEAITQKAAELAGLAGSARLPTVLTGLGADDAMAQVVDASGVVLASSANVAGRRPVAATPPGPARVVRTAHNLTRDDAAFRLVSRRVDTPAGVLGIHVATPLDDIAESLSILTTSLIVAVPLTVIVLAAVVSWLVGRTLRPVEAIRAEVSEIEGADVHRRVPVPDSNDEIGRLARTMNDMLERIDKAAQLQRRFVADASHELRSPLTRIRSELEVDLAHPDRADLEATHRSVLEEAIGLQHLVDDLLRLARSDAGAGSGRRRAVALDDVVAQVAGRIGSAGDVAVDLSGFEPAPVSGDADQLARAVGNIADNAVRHARTSVAFTLVEVDGSVVLTITDDGPGIPPEHRERVFERFTRLDDSRTAATGGAGLGLAIAREIIEQHGGAITLDADHDGGARFVITLPSGASA